MSGKPVKNQTKRNLRSKSKTNVSPAVNNKPVNNKSSRQNQTPINTDTTHTPAQTNSTPAYKRKANRTSPPSLDIVQAAKKSTHTMAQISIDDIKKLFDDQSVKMANDMQSRLDSHTSKMVTEIQAKLDAYSSTIANTIESTVKHEVNLLGEQLKVDIRSQVTDINKKIDQIQSNVNSEIVTMKKSVDNCLDRIHSNEDDVKRIAKLNELKIKGIPYTPDENLHEIFKAISNYVGFDLSHTNNLPRLNRMQKRDNETKQIVQQPTIILNFIAKHIRDNFYLLYLTKVASNPLMTEHINLAQGSRVIISENLTAVNQNLFVSAMKLKLDKKLTKVFTRDGLVQIKITNDSRPKTIRPTRDLDIIVAESQNVSLQATQPSSTPHISSTNVNPSIPATINQATSASSSNVTTNVTTTTTTTAPASSNSDNSQSVVLNGTNVINNSSSMETN